MAKEKDEEILKLKFEDDLRVKWVHPEEWFKSGRPLKPGEAIGTLITARNARRKIESGQ
jgi:hypothetical protein